MGMMEQMMSEEAADDGDGDDDVAWSRIHKAVLANR